MSYSIAEVKELILTCREAGIRTFACGALKFSLGDVPLPAAVVDPELQERQLVENEIRAKQEQLDQLRLEDPHEFERLLLEDLDKQVP